MGESGWPLFKKFHVDLRSERRKAKTQGSLINQDHPQVVEIWNLVLCNTTEKLMVR